MTVIEEYSVEVIQIILSMTFTGSIISSFLFLIKPIIKDKLPKTFQYYMWLSVVIALMLPVSEMIVIPVPNQAVMPMKTMYDITRQLLDTASEKTVNLMFTPQNAGEQNIGQITYFPGTAVILFVFWQLGMLLVLGFHIICYAVYVRRLGRYNMRAEQQEIELLNSLSERKNTLRLYKNTMVETPILIGFFCPAVILPDKKYEDIKLRNILMHEITHRKRCDIFVKWLLIFAGAVHWFNPLVYFVRREMNKACELACDESVIKRFDNSEMQQYGDTLIAVAADAVRKLPLSITMFGDKRIMKERLDAIMKHKRPPKGTVIAASVILVTVVCAILGISTLRDMENGHKGNGYAENYPLPQDQKRIKGIELRKALRNYDKKNIAEAYVFLSDLDGIITNAYITIICQEKNPDLKMQSGIKSLASEELGLDIENVYVDYIDLESFISDTAKAEDAGTPVEETLRSYGEENSVSVNIDDAVMQSNPAEQYCDYLRQVTESVFTDEDGIEAAEAAVSYEEETKQYAIELSLKTNGEVDSVKIEDYKTYLSKTYADVILIIDGEVL